MKRAVIIGTAVAVLFGAGAAYAAFNNYDGSRLTFAVRAAGSAKAAKIVNMTETLKAAAPAGERAAPLVDIKVKVYGIRTNGSLFPTCTNRKIEANQLQYELACPPKSRIAQGPLNAVLGPANDPSQSKGIPCDVWVKAFNGGRSTQVFFFTTGFHTPNPRKYGCASFPTGTTRPYDGHISYHGRWWVLDVPLPPDISRSVADTPGLYGSLTKEVLSPISQTTRVSGRTRGYMESVACRRPRRPYEIVFTAQDYNSRALQSRTVSGSARC